VSGNRRRLHFSESPVPLVRPIPDIHRVKGERQVQTGFGHSVHGKSDGHKYATSRPGVVLLPIDAVGGLPRGDMGKPRP
jgi:hypothetical protein